MMRNIVIVTLMAIGWYAKMRGSPHDAVVLFASAMVLLGMGDKK